METMLAVVVIGIAIVRWVIVRDRMKRMDAVPTLRDRAHKYLGDGGYGLLVGGRLLNKVGALVLVIWLALLLVYPFTGTPQSGRTMSCVATSWTRPIAGC